MLRYRGEPLVEEVLEAEVVSLDEAAPPQIGLSVPDRLDQADELALVGCERPMSGRDRSAEEGTGCPSWTSTAPNPDDDASHSTTNSLAKSDMARTEGRRDGRLERREGDLRRVIPDEVVLLEEGREGGQPSCRSCSRIGGSILRGLGSPARPGRSEAVASRKWPLPWPGPWPRLPLR
jgi:hypothetical protein